MISVVWAPISSNVGQSDANSLSATVSTGSVVKPATLPLKGWTVPVTGATPTLSVPFQAPTTICALFSEFAPVSSSASASTVNSRPPCAQN